MVLYLIAASVICVLFLLLTLMNIRTMRLLSRQPGPIAAPVKVSVMIPARNEEANIARCLDSLLVQDYGDYEILVMDDNSTDGTWAILERYARENPRIRVFKGKPLADGWMGKQFALQQLSAHATGAFFMFVDADTVHKPTSISWVVTNMRAHKADFLSAYLKHDTGSLGELLIIPSIYIMTTMLMPLWLIPEKNHPMITHAIGQIIVCTREGFFAIGGYEEFKNNVIEDVSFARTMKARGYKTVFLDAKHQMRCRMYRSFSDAFRGIVRCLFAVLNGNMATVAGLIFLITAVIELPVANAIYQFVNGGEFALLSLVPVAIFTLLWFLKLRDRRMPFVAFLLYPISYLIIIAIAVTSVIKTGYASGEEWKGRMVKYLPKRETWKAKV